ncbi:MAG TPA: ABC transporter permease [Trebonia sp.]|jgi:ABC-2 type transport system permease protein|nr:ABC transporter permease [Trebonia sp.]
MVSATAASRLGRGLRTLTLTETKLVGRAPAVLFWAIGFPVAGLIVLGLIPAANKPVAGLGGISVLQTYLPTIVIFSLVMTAVNFLPATLAGYRERGVLRRMSTTPVRPGTLLTAQILVNLAVQVAIVALVAILAVAAFGATIGQPAGFIIASALTAAALSAVGLLVAAVCFTGKAANAVGAILFFVLMFFAGLWIPRAAMPAVLRDISSLTPAGAGGQAILSAAAGSWAPWWYFAVLAGYIAVCGVLAARLFRWE